MSSLQPELALPK